jgi:hypothetical protein
MDQLHQMFPEDEILLCGVILLYGVIAGALARLAATWLGRRPA